MRKKKEQPILENVPITDIGAEGKAIARVEGMVIFVPFVVPGDIADITTTPTNAWKRNAPISAPAGDAAGKSSTMPTSWPPNSNR